MTGAGIWNETSPRNGFQWTARIDHHFREGKDRIYASFNRTTTDKVGFGAPEVYPAFTESSPTSSLQLNTNWTRIVLSEPGERVLVLVGAALRRAREPERRHPRHHASPG